MEILDYDLTLGGSVSPAIIILYLCGGFIAKKYLKNKYINTTFMTLILGLIGAIVYSLLNKELPLSVVFLSFAVAIVTYDWGLKFLLNTLNKKGIVSKDDVAFMNDTELCNYCPLVGIDGFYKAIEIDEIDMTAPIQTDTLIYCNEYLYVPTKNDMGGIELTSNYIGVRPPKRPTLNVD